MEVVVDGGAGDMVASREFGDGVTFGVECEELSAVGVEFAVVGGGVRSDGSAEGNAFGFFACESLFGAQTNEVALDFGREPKGESQHFALNVVAQSVVVFDGPNAALFVHADIQNVHNHEEVAAESREFGADDDVVAMYASEQSPENAFVVGFCAADGFFYPVVDGQVVLLAETGDFEALVFDGLAVGGNSDVSVGHSVFCF